MPPQNRVRRDDPGDLVQCSASEPVPACGEPTPFVISQPEPPPTQLSPEDSILFDEVGQGLLLLTAQPAGQSTENNPREGDIDHGGSLLADCNSNRQVVRPDRGILRVQGASVDAVSADVRCS